MSRHYGHRPRDYRYGESQYKHFRNGKLIKPEEDPFMHFQRRESFFADNPNLDDVAQTVSPDSFNDNEYEQLLSKYADGGAYSSHGQRVENQRHVQNVKDKINSMKKKFQSLALVCDYVEGMEKYEHALETDPDSKMVKELTKKLENLKTAPKIHTNELSYAASSGSTSAPKQYGVSLADKRRQKAIATAKQVSSSASSRSQSRAGSPCRGGAHLAIPPVRLCESASPSRLHQPHHIYHPQNQPQSAQQHQHSSRSSSPHQRYGPRAPHCSSPIRFLTTPARSRNDSTCRPETRDVATQVGRARISSDSDDEKHRDSGVSTHDEDEDRSRSRKKLDSRLKRELLKPKFFLNESGNLVRVGSDDSIGDADDASSAPPPPAPKPSTNVETAAATSSVPAAAPVVAPVFRVYYDLVSSACRALYLFLKMASVNFEGHLVQLRAGDQFQPEFAKLSPAHRLPVMDDDGFLLREATAICRYIAAKNDLPGQWRIDCGVGAGKSDIEEKHNGLEPGDAFAFCDEHGNSDVSGAINNNDSERNSNNSNNSNNNALEKLRACARVDDYLSWHQGHLRPTCLQLFTQATLTPILSGQPPDFRRLKALKMELDNHCQFLETVFLDERPFIGGEQIGICDLFAICELMQPYAAGFDIRQSNLRRVRQWVERVKRETRPFFDEAHVEIIKIWESKGRYIIDEFDDFVGQ